jgi:hypothetical protein
MAYQHLAGAEGVPVGHRAGGRVSIVKCYSRKILERAGLKSSGPSSAGELPVAVPRNRVDEMASAGALGQVELSVYDHPWPI